MKEKYSRLPLQIEHYEIRSSKLPKGFDGCRIVFLTDLHSNLYGKNNEKLIAKIEEINPDYIMCTGDMIVGRRECDITVPMELFAALSKKWEIFYSLGNHEQKIRTYSETCDTVAVEYIEGLKNLGIHVLDNETYTLERRQDNKTSILERRQDNKTSILERGQDNGTSILERGQDNGTCTLEYEQDNETCTLEREQGNGTCILEHGQDKEICTLEQRQDRIHITGITVDYKYHGKVWKKVQMEADYVEEIAGKADEDKFQLLLAHNPEHLKAYADWGADLVLSGHIHGGIMILPKIGGVIAPSYELFPKFDFGRFKEGKCEMVLSRGLGTHTIHLRIFNKPEISLITLTRINRN